MDKKKPTKRRLLVCARKQLPFLFGLSLLSITNALLLLFMMAWLFIYGYDERIAMRLNSALAIKVFGILVLTTMITAFWSLSSTRSAFGLLQKVNDVLRDALAGEWPEDGEVRFRKNESEFSELERQLSTVVNRLDRKASLPPEIIECLRKLENDLLHDNLSKEEAAGCARKIRELVAKGDTT